MAGISGGLVVETAAVNAEAQIPGEITNGSPGLPVPKPEPIPFEIKRSLTKRVYVVESPEMPGLPAPEGLVNVTVKLVKDPGLPDPPPPSPALPPDDSAAQAPIDELTGHYRESRLVFVSATVYDHSRTYFRCAASGGGDMKEICGWSNLDFNHFSGFASYQVKASDGWVREYCLMMGIGDEDTQKTPEELAENDEANEAPVIPKLPDLATRGPAFVITEGDATDREAMEMVEGMHNLYRVEGARMEEAYHARVKAYEERKAYLLAHPPKPKDLIINYWRGRRPDDKARELKL